MLQQCGFADVSVGFSGEGKSMLQGRIYIMEWETIGKE